jgi:hypothetical protein
VKVFAVGYFELPQSHYEVQLPEYLGEFGLVELNFKFPSSYRWCEVELEQNAGA